MQLSSYIYMSHKIEAAALVLNEKIILFVYNCACYLLETGLLILVNYFP
jgi:hypothetical protein